MRVMDHERNHGICELIDNDTDRSHAMLLQCTEELCRAENHCFFSSYCLLFSRPIYVRVFFSTLSTFERTIKGIPVNKES